jgi:hypothetical protein
MQENDHAPAYLRATYRCWGKTQSSLSRSPIIYTESHAAEETPSSLDTSSLSLRACWSDCQSPGSRFSDAHLPCKHLK